MTDTRFDRYIARQISRYGEKFDSSELFVQFRHFYNTGDRIKIRVQWVNDGKTYAYEKFGTIGVTTGWKPCFMLMHNTRSMGSSDLLNRDVQIVAVKSGSRYVPIVPAVKAA